ncbi:MAG TPA: hypothetical protein VFT29_15785 [Gemmatimonadaceae bacterium]|nr:hypothetical protein [Gemmatimonadaceae bacterium]
MAWKKALFLGGAVLLLAACSDATAPNSLSRTGAKAAAIKLDADPLSQNPQSLTPQSFELEIAPLTEECRSGYYVRSGDKDVCWELPQ